MCTDDNRSLKLVAYRLVHTDEPYTKLHFYTNLTRVHILYAMVCQNVLKFDSKWCIFRDKYQYF